jgi:hypothetical protein
MDISDFYQTFFDEAELKAEALARASVNRCQRAGGHPPD